MVEPDAVFEVSDTLQHIRGRLPCNVTLTNRRHPLFGERVLAERAHRWRGELWLVLAHPDGAPARVRLEDTDLLAGSTTQNHQCGLVLSFEGIRRLRELLVSRAGDGGALGVPAAEGSRSGPGRGQR